MAAFSSLRSLSYPDLLRLKQTMPESHWLATRSEAIDSLKASLPSPKLSHFSFVTGQHPLAAIAQMIERMQAGTLSLADARRSLVPLDPHSRTVIGETIAAFHEAPIEFFTLDYMVKEMLNGRMEVNRANLLETFNRIPRAVRIELAGKIFHFSKDPSRGSCADWGEIHAADDLTCLKQAIDTIQRLFLEQTCAKIKDFACTKLFSLKPEEQSYIHYLNYCLERPDTQEDNWGERHATDDIPRLIRALHLADKIEGPKHTGQYDASWEGLTSSPSKVFYTPGKKLPKGEISFINGMGATLTQAVSSGIAIRDRMLDGYAMRNVYGASYGDHNIASALLGQDGVTLPQAKVLVKNWAEFFSKSAPDENFLQLCASRGAIDVFAGLKQLPRHLQQRIYVIAIAPGIIIEDSVCLRAFNHIILKDAVPQIAPNADLIGKGKPEIIICPDHADGTDPHETMGPSYLAAVKPLIEEFIKTNTISR